jgi:hypothetical protein
MQLYNSSEDYLYNLETSSPSEAKKLWKKSIKEKWGHKCAYCKSEEKLTIDHIIPQSKGGKDLLFNMVCACAKCNFSKSQENWEIWYKKQNFFTEQRMCDIVNWMKENEQKKHLYRYKIRRNNAS